ncbi:MAG TPA: N-acetylmuramidase family protein, partial [Bacteroidales bacterium]|nr:N-acetylmuramidase family protein [Bacteroidales bacterium]
YFYNINLGLTNEDWDKIAQSKENNLLINNQESCADDREKNPYIDQTFGLPPGTVRGVLALTLLFCAVGMMIYSMGQTGNADSQFMQDNLEFFKTAFLMMIAFYFGGRSLEILRDRWKKPSDVATGSKDAVLVQTETTTPASTSTTEQTEKTTIVAPTSLKTLLNTQSNPLISNVSLTEQQLIDDFPHLKDDNQVAARLEDADINDLADKYQLESAAIKAVIKVETGGSGFLADGRPKILFEGHIFWNELKKANIKPEEYVVKFPDIVYPHWTKQYYKGGTGEYDRLEKAKLIHEEAALKSASWGLFQIMGFNYSMAGFDSVDAFVKSQYESEKEHLQAFINFITYKNNAQAKATIDFLREKDWKSFAARYNGPRYAENQYDRKLEIAYNRYTSVNA